MEGCQVNVLDPMKAQSRAYENPLPGRPGARLINGLFAGWSTGTAAGASTRAALTHSSLLPLDRAVKPSPRHAS